MADYRIIYVGRRPRGEHVTALLLCVLRDGWFHSSATALVSEVDLVRVGQAGVVRSQFWAYAASDAVEKLEALVVFRRLDPTDPPFLLPDVDQALRWATTGPTARLALGADLRTFTHAT